MLGDNTVWQFKRITSSSDDGEVNDAPTILGMVVVNGITTGDTVTVRNSADTSGTIIAVYPSTLARAEVFPYKTYLDTGLNVTVGGSFDGDITVMYKDVGRV